NIARQVGRLGPHLADTAIDDIVDDLRIEMVACDKFPEQQRRSLDGMLLAQDAPAPPDWRANGINDDDFSHERTSVWCLCSLHRVYHRPGSCRVSAPRTSTAAAGPSPAHTPQSPAPSAPRNRPQDRSSRCPNPH